MENNVTSADSRTDHDVLCNMLETSRNKYFNCNIGFNDTHVMIRLSSPLKNVNEKMRSVICELNESGNLSYRFFLENNSLFITTVLDKRCDISAEKIADIITDLVAHLSTAIMTVSEA